MFDFGSEMYVWYGKKADISVRREGMQLAKVVWEEGWDYTDCHVNPLNSRHGDDRYPETGKERPPWSLFAKANQHMETLLFREKFLDWPDMSRVIKVKNDKEKDVSKKSMDLLNLIK